MIEKKKQVTLGYQSMQEYYTISHFGYLHSQVALVVRNPPSNAGDIELPVQFLGQEDPLEEGMATHSSILAWRIPWTQEPCGQQFIGLQRVEHNWSNLTHINNGSKSPYPLKHLLNYLWVKCMMSGFYLKILQDKKQR